MILKLILILLCAYAYVTIGYIILNLEIRINSGKKSDNFSKVAKWFMEEMEPETNLFIGWMYYAGLWIVLTFWPVITIMDILCTGGYALIKYIKRNLIKK